MTSSKSQDNGAAQGWDKTLVQTLVGLGLTHEHARLCLGQVAEHRQRAYLQGYQKGYNDGHAAALSKEKP